MTIAVDSDGVAERVIDITPQEFKDKWVAALKSGGLEQHKGDLHVVRQDGTHAYCCLGVGCDIAFNHGIVTRFLGQDGRYRYGAECRTGSLPPEVQDFIGVDDGLPYVDVPVREIHPDADLKGEPETVELDLASLNDAHGYKFPRLGELIDEQIEVKA